MKIFFKRYYGLNNIGDDVFVHTIDWFCKKYNFEYLVHGYNLPNGINRKEVNNKFNKLLFDIYFSIKSKRIVYWGGTTFEKVSSKRDLKFYLNKICFLNKKVLGMGISIGPFETDKNKKLIKELNILVFNKNDYSFSKDIYNEISKEITQVNFINYTSDTETIIDKIANSHLLLRNRLHSAIIAYSYDVPFILNEYHNKCTEFLETIEAKYTIEDLAINTSENIKNTIEMSKHRINPDEYRKLLLEKMDKIAKVINNEIL